MTEKFLGEMLTKLPGKNPETNRNTIHGRISGEILGRNPKAFSVIISQKALGSFSREMTK